MNFVHLKKKKDFLKPKKAKYGQELLANFSWGWGGAIFFFSNLEFTLMYHEKKLFLKLKKPNIGGSFCPIFLQNNTKKCT